MPRYLLPAPPDLQSLIWYFHVETHGSGEVVIPAMPFPTVGVYVLGGGDYLNEQDWQGTPQAFYIGPFSRPIRMRTTAGSCFICARLWPGQQMRLFDLPADALRDVFVPLELLCREVSSLMVQLGEISSPVAWVATLADWLRRQAYLREDRPIAMLYLPQHVLVAPAATLAMQSALSLRQFERRFRANYGLSLRDMQRQLRYMRTLNHMMNQPVPRGDLADLANAAGYYDQAQMTRDFRELIGLTPARLLRQQQVDDSDWQLFRFEEQERELVFGAARQRGVFEPTR